MKIKNQFKIGLLFYIILFFVIVIIHNTLINSDNRPIVWLLENEIIIIKDYNFKLLPLKLFNIYKYTTININNIERRKIKYKLSKEIKLIYLTKEFDNLSFHLTYKGIEVDIFEENCEKYYFCNPDIYYFDKYLVFRRNIVKNNNESLYLYNKIKGSCIELTFPSMLNNEINVDINNINLLIINIKNGTIYNKTIIYNIEKSAVFHNGNYINNIVSKEEWAIFCIRKKLIKHNFQNNETKEYIIPTNIEDEVNIFINKNNEICFVYENNLYVFNTKRYKTYIYNPKYKLKKILKEVGNIYYVYADKILLKIENNNIEEIKNDIKYLIDFNKQYYLITNNNNVFFINNKEIKRINKFDLKGKIIKLKNYNKYYLILTEEKSKFHYYILIDNEIHEY